MDELILSPSQFVAMLNQTLEAAYPLVTIEGELSEFRVRKNQWVYFKLKDEGAVVDFFGSVYQLKSPLEDGMLVRAVARPRLHPKFGFSLSYESVVPVGEGAIRRAYELLKAKLEAEGLFAPERKRALPALPSSIGLISSHQAAGAEDFLTVLGQRWGGLEVLFANVAVQGETAPTQIVRALDYFNQHESAIEVLVIVRGGGSAEDLSVFNDETLVRAIAASRIPTLIGVGHEQDTTLADLAADRRAATPTEAAVLLVPDRRQLMAQLAEVRQRLGSHMQAQVSGVKDRYAQSLKTAMHRLLEQSQAQLAAAARSLAAYDPKAVLGRGYSILRSGGAVVSSIKQVAPGRSLSAEVADGQIETEVVSVKTQTT